MRWVTKYQFQVDGRGGGPIRNLWENAAHDAVADGYAHWVSDTEIKINSDQGAAIARIEVREED